MNAFMVPFKAWHESRSATGTCGLNHGNTHGYVHLRLQVIRGNGSLRIWVSVFRCMSTHTSTCAWSAAPLGREYKHIHSVESQFMEGTVIASLSCSPAGFWGEWWGRGNYYKRMAAPFKYHIGAYVDMLYIVCNARLWKEQVCHHWVIVLRAFDRNEEEEVVTIKEWLNC
jgi:hypothetical protein